MTQWTLRVRLFFRMQRSLTKPAIARHHGKSTPVFLSALNVPKREPPGYARLQRLEAEMIREMFDFKTSKKELRHLKALELLHFVTALRLHLTNLRENKVDQAINQMEMCLDNTIIALASDVSHCDEPIKDQMVSEYRMVWDYRAKYGGLSEAYLSDMDETLRKSILDGKAEADRLLETYRPDKS